MEKNLVSLIGTVLPKDFFQRVDYREGSQRMFIVSKLDK